MKRTLILLAFSLFHAFGGEPPALIRTAGSYQYPENNVTIVVRDVESSAIEVRMLVCRHRRCPADRRRHGA